MSASLWGRPPKFVIDDFPLSISCRPLSIRGIGIDRKFRWADFGQKRNSSVAECLPESSHSPPALNSRRELISARGPREGGLVKALLKSSLIASVVFAAAWFREPPAMIIRDFIGYGILITILSMVFGLPIALLIERLKIGRWWTYLAFAVTTGALLGAVLSSRPSVESAAPIPATGEQETSVENPFAITFSPWTRSQPGFAGDNPPIQWSDYRGTIAFGAVIGGVLGISFFYFYSRSKKPGKFDQRSQA
jgi:hypothetical protein